MKFLALLVLSAALLTSACGNNAAPGGEKVFRYGTPAYGIANENAGMDRTKPTRLERHPLRRRRNAF